MYAEPAGAMFDSESAFPGACVSTIATFEAAELPTLPTLSVSCSRYS